MKNKLLFVIAVIPYLLFPKITCGQAPDLGTAAGFVLFTTTGAVGNTGISQITGNVGTNTGAITGFGNVDGVMHNGDAASAQASTDLLIAYNQLNTTPTTAAHAPVLGNGETLFAGVYNLAAAGSLVLGLTLDAQGDSSAVFIFKVGGAFSTAASSSITLINGALACNVFWKVEGAISMATLTIMKGTMIANNGAVSMGAGGTLEGRMLSTTGAVSVYGDLAYMPLGCGIPVLTGPITPVLNFASCYSLFSSDGMVSNSGVTHVTDDVGTNTGATTGYSPLYVAGLIHHFPDASTILCAIDLQTLFNYINMLPYDIELLYPAQLGNNLVITPHTYIMNGSAALTDTLYINAEGDTNAIFVIQINGNLTTSVNSNVKLINGALKQNVYWMIKGSVTINNSSTFSGTIICKNGAINLNTGVTLNGRAFTDTGSLNTNTNVVTSIVPLDCDIPILPIELISFTGSCVNQNIVLKWSTATEFNNNYYTVEHSSDGVNWQIIATVNGAGNSSVLTNYSFTDNKSYSTDSYYRLKQTDYNGSSITFSTILIKSCAEDLNGLDIYPNPSCGMFNLIFDGDKEQVNSIEIYNLLGKRIYYSGIYQSTINLRSEQNGIYFVYFNLDTKIITKKIIIEK